MKSLGFEGQWLTLCLLAESIAHFSFWLWNGTGLLLKKWFVLSLEACSSYRMSLLTWKLHLRSSNVVPVLHARTMAFVQKHNVILGTLPHSSSLGWILEVHTDTSTHPMPFLSHTLRWRCSICRCADMHHLYPSKPHLSLQGKSPLLVWLQTAELIMSLHSASACLMFD